MSNRSDSLFGPGATRVARVALPVPVNSLFDYAVPDALASDVKPGCRVRVVMRKRSETGVVIALAEKPEREG
ncbi:MAG TPA: hypothetical protein VFT98_12405, partial [Myxococcota bacterium]|nr:hypothetical protein [Myxococcota bacterium]